MGKTQLLPLLFLRSAAIEAAISIGVAMVARSGSSTGLKLELCLAPCAAQHVCSGFVQETND